MRPESVSPAPAAHPVSREVFAMPSPMCNSVFSTATKAICALLLTLALSFAAKAQTFTVLHTFNGKNGAEPVGTVVLDGAGNIYGTTGTGGIGPCADGCGAAFMLTKTGKQVGVFSFNGTDGLNPYAGLLHETNGNFYGTTVYGGDTNCNPPYGCGTVFRLSKTGRETILHKFTGTPDGWFPEALLVGDSSGNLYGTTYLGGTSGLGAIFKIDTSGKETILYSFAGPPEGGGDGAFSYEGVIRDASGNLYGVTSRGGTFGAGVVYELDAAGNETLLYSFTGGTDGSDPDSVLLLDSQGNLYGTTASGGNSECGGTGCGVVFELSRQSGGGWSETVLYTFCSVANCTDGEEPGVGPLIMDSSRALYGTTTRGGTYHNCNGDSCGVVFKLDATRKEAVLHSFTGGADGANPVVGLAMDNSGNLYGATQAGGATCYKFLTCGVVFKIAPQPKQ